MKEALLKIKDTLRTCQGDFNLISTRCDYVLLDGRFKQGSECVHPYHLASSGLPKECTMNTCIIIKDIAEY